MKKNQTLLLPVLLTAAVLMSACGHRKPSPAESGERAAPKSQKAAEKPPEKPADKPEKAEKSEKVAKAESKPAPADKIEKVEDDGKPGEVRGTPAADSKFTQLRMGMSMKEVKSLIGAPTDKHSYITGKGFWSVSGTDSYRQEFIYKGLGRLTFAANGGFSTESHLIRIIHNAEEKGTRS